MLIPSTLKSFTTNTYRLRTYGAFKPFYPKIIYARPLVTLKSFTFTLKSFTFLQIRVFATCLTFIKQGRGFFKHPA